MLMPGSLQSTAASSAPASTEMNVGGKSSFSKLLSLFHTFNLSKKLKQRADGTFTTHVFLSVEAW